jgi:hypothetical protein
MKGTVYKVKFNGAGKAPTFKKKYGLVRNKKFKYYRDRTMTELQGVFDFDRIQCVIMIDDGNDHTNNKGNQTDEPRRFKIEVIGMKKEFIFEAKNSKFLREWTQALYSNWHAAKSFTLLNAPKLLNTKFWKVIAFNSLILIARDDISSEL